MPLTLYYNPLSQPSRAVECVLLLGDIQYNPKIIDLKTQENLKPEYTAIIPTQSVPAIDDDGFKLFESHAILRYLVNKFHIKSLYPEDPNQIGLIECYLDWHHTGTRLIAKYTMDFVFAPMMFQKPQPENKDQRLKEVEDILMFIEYVFLGQGKYQYIQNQKDYSIADLACIFELVGCFAFNYTFDKFPSLKNYVVRMLAIPQVKQVNSTYYGMLNNIPDLNEFIKQQIQ